jgi:hypothetical protein
MTSGRKIWKELCVCGWKKTQKWLSLCDAVVREKAVQLRVCLKTV